MKKHFKLLALSIAVLVAVGIFAAASCLEVKTGGDITIIIGNQTFEMTAVEHEFIGEVLDELTAEHQLAFTYSTSAFGRMILTLGPLNPLAINNEFIAIYISILEPQWSSPYNRTVDGITFYSANFGIDGLPVLDGVKYLFVISSW